ncbi:hypothetical protein ACFL3H_08635 [Gemmatimonadota bacterium]
MIVVPLKHACPPLFILGLIALITACSGGSSGDGQADIPILVDLLTLEATIEDDPTLDDFQIVSPRGIGVDAVGNIYLADEYSVKVYGPDGSPLKTIGREGAGPGEFNAAFTANIGPTGCIAAMDILWEANIYAPDGEFLHRSRYRNEDPFREHIQASGFTFTMMREVVALDSERLLIDLFALNSTLPGPFVGNLQLICATTNSLGIVCSYTDYESIKLTENNNTSVVFQGDLIWSIIDADHLLFTHTSVDRVEDGDNSCYNLIVLDLETSATDTLMVPWLPETIPPEVKTKEPEHNEFLNITFEVEPVVREIMNDTRYYPPLKDLKTDHGLIFGFHFSPTDSFDRDFEEDDLEVEAHLVDIIDIVSGRLLARAEFPFLPEVIRDGRAYRLFTPQDDFSAVHVYQIDPRIYALRDEHD